MKGGEDEVWQAEQEMKGRKKGGRRDVWGWTDGVE